MTLIVVACRRIAASCMVALAVAGAGAHAAPPYPSKSIRYVVPQAPGGSSDTLARIIAARLTENLGQQVIVDNRPGATGIIGAELVARSAPDGYTLVQVATSHATNPALGVKLPFDTLRDFAPIALLSQQPNLWIVHPSLPARNMRELIALAKSRPGQIDFASSGTGGSQHLAGELLNVMAGIKLVHIPYKGSPPALIDVLGGRVALMSSTLAPAMPHVKAGRVRALAVTSVRRSPAAPDIPTVAESGLPGVTRRSRGKACSRRPTRRPRRYNACMPKWRRFSPGRTPATSWRSRATSPPAALPSSSPTSSASRSPSGRRSSRRPGSRFNNRGKVAA